MGWNISVSKSKKLFQRSKKIGLGERYTFILSWTNIYLNRGVSNKNMRLSHDIFTSTAAVVFIYFTEALNDVNGIKTNLSYFHNFVNNLVYYIKNLYINRES